MAELLSERLFVLLRREVETLQAEFSDNIPLSQAAGAARADAARAATANGAKRRAPPKAGGEAAPAPRRASAKERVESIGQAARTLEKLLELKRLERLAVEGGDADAAETARLREGATLFDADGAYAGDPRPVDEGPEGPSAAMDGA
ncbi:hypothetical protein [Aurantimonas coralicida]|uniref:hypothetical protein n=1 Tax=Aurantimonas coralicida TaxID=182270 RepID=UPI001D18954D|nr:hypothetical protein [Aurantimonas coralicida]MCC4296544.1 hypothetical protein [Aurantimonas coralicida]